MGVVYAAYDPALDRKVALKVLHPVASGGATNQRLLREAQAMARLQHPNIVAVHDVGKHQDRTYVAMEFVDGSNLRCWLQEQHSWQEIIEVFAAAGEGLAAAHDAGLIHRDLKPANILMGADGRVRVTDFGLARMYEPAPESEQETAAEANPDAEPSPLASPITKADALLGTPAFMAPEQVSRRHADPRSDQFSFCVSLYLALYGVHPFGPPGSPAELVSKAGKGAIAPPPAGAAQVPKQIHDALLRGLRCQPDERFGSMGELLAALTISSRQDRRRLWTVSGLTAVAMVVLAVWLALTARNQLCAGGGELLAEVWNDDRQQSIAASFRETAGDFGVSTSLQVELLVRSYSERWATAYRLACEATHVHGEQSVALLDQQVACLKLRLRELDKLLHLFAGADLDLVAGAADATLGLRSPESCGDTAALLRRAPLPDDPELRARIAAAEALLAEVTAVSLTGDYHGAMEALPGITTEVTAIGYEPLLAEALCQQGAVQAALGRGEDAVGCLRASMVAAERGQDDPAAIRAIGELLWSLSVELHQFEELDGLFAIAEAKIDRIGGNDELQVEVLRRMSEALIRAGHYDRATALQEKMLALARDLYGEKSAALAPVLHVHGNTLLAIGRQQEAIDLFHQALAVKEQHLGGRHPSLATTYTSLSRAEAELGRYQEAATAAEQAVDITQAVFGPHHVNLATPLNNLAYTYHDLQQLQPALTVYTRAIELIRTQLGDDHPRLISTYLNLGGLYNDLGLPQEEIEAVTAAEQLAARTIGEQHPLYAYAANNLGMLLLANDQAAEGVAYLEKALAIRTTITTEPTMVAVTRYNLGRALWAAGRHRHGHNQVLAARDALREIGDADSVILLEAWLNEHPLESAN